MELPKIRNHSLDKFGPLKFNNRFPVRDGIILKALQEDNIFIKKKLSEFENRLNHFSGEFSRSGISNLKENKLFFRLINKGTSYDQFNSESLMSKNCETNETFRDRSPSKLNLIKSIRENECSKTDFHKTDEQKENFETNYTRSSIEFGKNTDSKLNLEDLSMLRLKSARGNDLSFVRKNSARVGDAYIRLNSKVCKSPDRLNSARAGQNLLDRIHSARNDPQAKEIPTINTIKTTENPKLINTLRELNENLEMDDIIENLKKYRHSPTRKSIFDEKNKLMRPKTSAKMPEFTSNSRLQFNEEHSQLKKDTSRSKSAIVKDPNSHTFYSRSWRIHSEFHENSPDPKQPADATNPIFYIANRKLPETFIFHPDWI